MKIYPSNKKIKEKENIKRGEIPLAELRHNNIILGANTKKIEQIPNEKEKIRPYHRFLNSHAIGFNNYGEIKHLSKFMVKQNEEYYYLPDSIVEFRPLFVNFKMLIENKSEYDPLKKYFIEMNIIDKEDKIIESAMNIFSSGLNERSLPNNIYINKNQNTKSVYVNNTLENTDWVLIESDDGVHYSSGEKIDFNLYAENNTNVWLLTNPQKIYYPEDIVINYNNIFNNNNHKIKNIRRIKSNEYFDKNSCIGIKHNNKNIVVTTDVSMFSYENIKLIYEIIMYPILKGRIMSSNYSTWVSDYPVDFEKNNSNRHGYTSKVFPIKQILDEIKIPIDNYKIIEIIKSSESVKEKIEEENITFKYREKSKDPKKSLAVESYYTQKDTIVYYYPEDIEKIEKPIDIFIQKEKNKLFLSTTEGKSSRLGFSIKKKKKFALNSEDPLYLTAINESLHLIKQEDYKKKYGAILYEIFPYRANRREIMDIRITGGGAKFPGEESQALMDINHLLGKPYRKEGVLVIDLPEKYRHMYDEILKEIKKQNVANEYIIINFEQGSEKE